MAIFTITVNANNAPVVNISWSDDTTNNKFGSDASSPAKLLTVVDASSILNYTWQSSIDNGVTYTSLATTTSPTVYNENLVENDTTIIRLKVEDEYGLIGYSNLLQYEHIELPPVTVVTGLTWTLTVNNPCNPNPWVINANNTVIRYNIENSVNCNGTCASIQAGTATATITVGSNDVNMGVFLEGIGELQAPDYEKISFRLDNVEIINAHAAGGGLGCQVGPAIQTTIVPGPYLLLKNTVHTLFINFTTNDALYHVGSYYEASLSFTEIVL